jgi:hypothetical protein
MFQRAAEFVFQSIANAEKRVREVEAASGVANPVPAARAFIECVFRKVPAFMQRQLYGEEPLQHVSGKLSPSQHAEVFAPENIMGWRLHVWGLEPGLNPNRAFANQVGQNQYETELLSTEAHTVRSAMMSHPGDLVAAREALFNYMRAKYRSKHPDANDDEIDEHVEPPNDIQLQRVMTEARQMPSALALKESHMSMRFSATEMARSIYTYQEMARFVHGVYAHAAGILPAHDGHFVPAVELEAQDHVPGHRGHATALAYWKTFNFENSVQVLVLQNDGNTIDPFQGSADQYGLHARGSRLSFPYPAAVWEIKMPFVAPPMLALYKAPWRIRTTVEILIDGYAGLIAKSQERERSMQANKKDAAAAGAGAAGAGGVG